MSLYKNKFEQLQHTCPSFITPSDTVKDIGVLVPADNSWSPHIGRMINSAQRTAWVLSVLRDRIKLYRALLPCLEWSTKIEDTKAIESLQRTFFSKIVALNT